MNVPESTTRVDEQVPTGIVWDRPRADVVRARVITAPGDGNRELIATIEYTLEQAAEMCSQLLRAMS
ncbi:hypothetical protein SEA_PHLOP_84 [Gordonia phage Phlop]|uniref:Uncharacterized protein n=13 Tax=Wizardvirus TaxID=2169658 RepID=A0A7D5FNF2_9CAUD|nr:hypothetical protein BH794_gp82 [Gordonia phage Wizard]YP_009284857.1 hypothetical protein BI083_gp86 [Gordonia phage Twister6]YP_010096785.1 helix-turn-helix DNA binding domain protein [Gordonia phage KimmyK]YP_010102050.1 hypothetical protein KNU53_gp88 [Gordonia phage SmokingBunny]YP_010102146.1 hypothetical protein KNU54_gp89 [Gordonia phage VanDeWege]YP_010102338.1 hypothetical protein KNU56_gp87 [Gordonia phage Arri]YP_010102433.1 hypothetical protein KNU57_gp88 [Gordonia phage Valar